LSLLKSFRLGMFFCCSLLPASPVHAQLSHAGAVAGVATTADGAVVAGAKITLTTVDGAARTASTSADGTFSIVGLPSETYSLSASSPGFAIYTQSSVPVAVGRTLHLRITFVVAGSQQTVNVTAGQTAFDPSQTSSVINIDRDRVEELPIPNRNYLTFVLLAPQVAPANPALTQQSGTQGGSFSFGGLRPGSNAVYLDGVDDDDEYSGGSRTELSPEAISDFQIVNHGFAAESGGGAGGSIDVQTRRGANRRHGDAFVFVQNAALNAIQPLELPPQKPDESRFRAGLSQGGALQRDKTFYYVAAEQELAWGEDANDLPAATVVRINKALGRLGPLRELSLQTGFIPTSNQQTEISGRIDRTLTATEAVMLRYAFSNTRDVNDAFFTDDLSDRSARGSSFFDDNSLNGTLSSTLRPDVLSRLSFEIAQRRGVDRTESTTAPGVLIAGTALFGTPYSGNGRRFETHLEFNDGLSVQKHRHLFQGGFNFDHVGLRARIFDGSQGFYVFPTVSALESGDADFFTQFFGNANANLGELRMAAYAQDHWTPSAKLAVDYGARYEVNRLPSPIPQDSVNFSPRFGVAWTARPSLVVRSGFGIFYDRFLLSTIDRLLRQNGINGFTQVVEDTAAADLYRSGTAASQPLAGVAPSIWRAQAGLRNPYSEVASLSLEQALPLQATLKGEYQYVHGVKLGRTTNVNLALPVILTTENAPALGITAPTAQQLGRPVFTPQRNNPAYDAVNQFATAANSTYNGVTVSLNRQFTDDFQVLAGYTFSKTLDDASYDTEQPQNPYALRGERALSLEDQRHRFTLNGLYLIGPDLGDPQDAAANANPGPLMRLLDGLEFAPILSVTSGFHANPVVGVDSNREHIYPFAARPAGYARNSLSTAPQVNFDFRVLKMVPLGPGHLDVVAESFNLLNHTNVSLLNTVFGSDGGASSGFGRPIDASTARRIQFSLDFEY